MAADTRQLPRVKSGDVITADMWNMLVDHVNRSRVMFGQGNGFDVQETPFGQLVRGITPGLGGLYWCTTPGAVSAASGSWPSLTPQTFTADVYHNEDGAQVLVESAVTVYWWYKDAAAAGKLVPCLPNADGTYDAIADSCTAV